MTTATVRTYRVWCLTDSMWEHVRSAALPHTCPRGHRIDVMQTVVVAGAGMPKPPTSMDDDLRALGLDDEPSAIDQLADVAMEDMKAKLRPLLRRQDHLEQCLDLMQQRLHEDHCVKVTHIDGWRQCWMQQCEAARRVLAQHVTLDD